MTYSFSQKSQEKLSTCHPNLQKILNIVIKYTDFTVIEGHRSYERQQKLLSEGKSTLKVSKHNSEPSMAVDIAPYPIDWNDINRFKALANFIKCTAQALNIPIIHGGDWKRFKDYPHFELIS